MTGYRNIVALTAVLCSLDEKRAASSVIVVYRKTEIRCLYLIEGHCVDCVAPTMQHIRLRCVACEALYAVVIVRDAGLYMTGVHAG